MTKLHDLTGYFFDKKLQLTLSQGLYKGRPSYKKSRQPSKRTSSTSKHEKFLNFFQFLWVIFARLDSDPDSESGSGYGSTDLIESGFGSAKAKSCGSCGSGSGSGFKTLMNMC